jgi:predicted TIM-barrel fold metal-dependent hydrolase
VEEAHYEAEAHYILKLAETHPELLGVVASGRPELPGFADYVKRIKHPLLKGIRRVLHTESDELSQGEIFRDSIRCLAEHDLTFDICVLERQLPLACELVKSAPEVSFVLDHCGVPDISGGTHVVWAESIKMLASFPNVVCKVSGLPSYAAPNFVPDTLRPYLDTVVAQFGWDRLLFGGDWPVVTLNSDLKTWSNGLEAYFADASAEQKQKVFSGNARRIYRLGEV